jgi:hypothetical protein
VHVSADTIEPLPPGFDAEARGVIDLRNRGELPTFFLNAMSQSRLSQAATESV